MEAWALVTGAGLISSFRPSADDDHKDFIFDERGGYISIYVQVKGSMHADSEGRAHALVEYRKLRPRASRRLVYVIVQLDRDDLRIVRMWLIPSKDFNRLANRAMRRSGNLILSFVGGENDKWTRFLIDPRELGSKLLEVMQAAQGVHAVRPLVRPSLVLTMKHRDRRAKRRRTTFSRRAA